MTFKAKFFCLLFCLSFSATGWALERFGASEPRDDDFDPSQGVGSPSFFGGYDLRLSYSRPEFTKLKYYDDLYGPPSWYPSFGVGKRLFGISSILSTSAEFRVGYYSDMGFTGKRNVGDKVPTTEHLEKDDGELELVLMPYQLMFRMQISPFVAKYVLLDAWVGYEELYFQESRLAKGSSNGSGQAQSIVNMGWHNSLVVGGAMKLLLNHLDEASIGTLTRSLGIGFVYLAPYYEYVEALKGSKVFIANKKSSTVKFSRQTFGLSFIFESLY